VQQHKTPVRQKKQDDDDYAEEEKKADESKAAETGQATSPADDVLAMSIAVPQLVSKNLTSAQTDLATEPTAMRKF